MMDCQTYIFRLTSGQLADSRWTARLSAAQHRLLCRHCRAFTRNDTQLSSLLQAYQAHLQQPLPPEPDRERDSS